MTDWSKLKVPELKAELKTRNLPQNGLKAALVARLEEADSEKVAGDEPQQSGQGDDDATIESNTVDNSPRDEEAAPPEPQPQPEAHDDTVPTPPTPSIETPNAQAVSDDMKKDAQSAAVGAAEAAAAAAAQAVIPPIIAQPSKEESMPDLTPVGTTELKEDIEKRKRRSLSPPPANGDAPRKRQRQDTDVPVTDTDKVVTTEEDARWVENHNNLDSAEVNAEMVEVAEEGAQGNPTIVDTAKEEVVVEHASRRSSEGQQQRPVLAPSAAANMEEPPRYKFRAPEDQPMDDYETNLRNDRSPSPAFDRRSPARDYGIRSPEAERSVAPAIHPATSALYIRDFQRPLNRNQLRDYIITLATPRGQSPDPDVIIDFFLDSICTHAFIAFTNTSAASRVRSEIHDRIWPDERTRRPLWADFIPDSKVTEWIETENSAAAARSGKKWEVAYDMDGDGNVTASLQETGEVPAQLRKQSSASVAPTPRLGVAGAPLGPRADQRRRDDGLRYDAPADRRPSFDRSAQYPPAPLQSNVDMIFTKSSPSVSFLPVPRELAERRLDNIDSLYAKDAEAEFRENSESHRYTFEGEILVDRGPEIFPGIRRPPGVRRVPLPRNLLAGGARPLPPVRGSRGYDRNDDRGYRDYRDERPRDSYRDDRGPPVGRGGYGGRFDRGDRYERPFERRKDDFGPGSNYRNNYREGAHWRGGGGGMDGRY